MPHRPMHLVVLVSAFVMVSTVCFTVLLITVPPRAQLFVKVGARAPVPYFRSIKLFIIFAFWVM